MTIQSSELNRWLDTLSHLIEQEKEPEAAHFTLFIQHPELSFHLIDIIDKDKSPDGGQQAYYAACIFAFEICVAQFQAMMEVNTKQATKHITQLMTHLAGVIRHSEHHLSYWLPILNAFYEAHIELNADLQAAYHGLIDNEQQHTSSTLNHLDAIEAMLNELDHLSDFDVAENFFAQGYAMPAEFFADLTLDLFALKTGQSVALLMLLHPLAEVRELVVEAIGEVIDGRVLSAQSRARLKAIRQWYPASYHPIFDQWLRRQYFKGGHLTDTPYNVELMGIKASEVDGSGAQGLFLHIKQGRNHKLAGVLYKMQVGIKEAWVTPTLTNAQIKKYQKEAFDDNITLRTIDIRYLEQLTQHFLACMVENNTIPDLHLLEIQELLQLHIEPKLLDIELVLQDLTVQIVPFTPDIVQTAFKESKHWLNQKNFAASWFVESATVDKLVNRVSVIDKGMRICQDVEQAIELILTHEFEQNRASWLFHFVWTALWLKTSARKHERTWQTCCLIAHAIANHYPLKDIPIMQAISHASVLNSLETMSARGTHLHTE
ncbi:MAG: hypothetical protein CMF38_07515 [Legionellaceae bacterium]|nr:hypothetical protein [Legionellaceae bacterium]MBJ16461.1 hypothetical protein [Legionellaceae bacterium]HCA89790.1 hypothetical protein [Legionellales bacterium]|tara:strand:- start:3180 stop:4817 length:1638 start_codon:yes stop_codon:yes gene_type:complete